MLTIILAFFTSCAFSLPFEFLDTAEISARMPEGTFLEKLTAFLPALGERMYPASILLFVLFLIAYRFLLSRIRQKHFSMAALLTAALFTVYLIAGECASKYYDLGFLFRNMPQCLVTVIKTAGYLPLLYCGVRAGFAAADENKVGKKGGSVYQLVFEDHSYLFPLLILLICWLPYVIAFYPGFVPSDGLKQLNNYFGSGNFTDNHPAFSSMLMGWAMKLGRKIGNDNLGLFLFTGPQLLINALCIAACFPLYKKLASPAWLRRLSLFSFALIPIWPNYAYSLLKDSLYMAMIVLITVLLIQILLNAENFCKQKRNLILLMLALCLMMFVRHEGQYVGALLIISLFTLPAPRRQWRWLLPVLLIPLLLINVFNRVIRPQLHIPDAPAREALTMPMRQTSAVVVNMESSLTDEERAVLEDIFVYDKISAMYEGSFENADALKGQFSPWAPREKILNYMKVWAKLGLKHPLLYLNVFLCSNSRYYDPFLEAHRGIYGWFGIEQETYVNKGLFDIAYSPSTAPLRSVLVNIADGLPTLPLTSLFYSLGANVWIMIFCLACLLRKKTHGIIIPLLPGLITFVMLQNSAINGFFRYLLPLLITLPICMGWTIFQARNQ